MESHVLFSFMLFIYAIYAECSESCPRETSMSMVDSGYLWTTHSIGIFYVKTTQQCVHTCLSQMSNCISLAYNQETGSCQTFNFLPEYEPEKLVFPLNIKLYDSIIKRDCSQIKELWKGNSGVYVIRPCQYCSAINVYCDMKKEDGGWTVFQRRQDGSVDFFRNWNEYAAGFGNLCHEFWIGNKLLHKMTSSANYELRVDLEDFDGNLYTAKYDSFRIEDETNKYRLHLGSYIASQSTIDDSLLPHQNARFSTYDQDNDSRQGNCANDYRGGWWYLSCFKAYFNGIHNSDTGISWLLPHTRLKLRFTEMKIRRIC